MFSLSLSEEDGQSSITYDLTVDGQDLTAKITNPGLDERICKYHNISPDDYNWFVGYLRNTTLLKLGLIVYVMLTPRFDFNDVKRELVKL
jgi:hypothetical protein